MASTRVSSSKRSTGRSARRHRAAAVCAPGLEEVCSSELRKLGCRPRPGGPGVVEFEANARQLYSANVWLRTASRVVVRLATFRATDFVHLQDHAMGLDWGRWIPSGFAPRFRVSSNESKLYHTDAIAQRLHQVVGPPSLGEPEQLFVVRIDRNTVTVSADSSGEGLHRRPWRTETGTAPLRPNLAAALLLASDWDPATSLVDPFCGSGTIGIEAALLARGLPPGGQREFAFQHWPNFEPGSWASVLASIEAGQAEVGGGEGGEAARIVLADRDQAAVDMTRANAERAGVLDDLDVSCRVVSHLKAQSGPGLVATNPPYGRRLGKAELNGLYARLGAVVRERLPDHALALLTAEASLAKAADRRLRPRARFRTGGLAVQLYHREPGRPAEPPAEPEGPK